MGTMTVSISDETEDRLREFLWKKYRGKGKGRIGHTVEEAIKEYLDLHESEAVSE